MATILRRVWRWWRPFAQLDAIYARIDDDLADL
jgi:hypothetical protein